MIFQRNEDLLNGNLMHCTAPIDDILEATHGCSTICISIAWVSLMYLKHIQSLLTIPGKFTKPTQSQVTAHYQLAPSAGADLLTVYTLLRMPYI